MGAKHQVFDMYSTNLVAISFVPSAMPGVAGQFGLGTWYYFVIGRPHNFSFGWRLFIAVSDCS